MDPAKLVTVMIAIMLMMITINSLNTLRSQPSQLFCKQHVDVCIELGSVPHEGLPLSQTRSALVLLKSYMNVFITCLMKYLQLTGLDSILAQTCRIAVDCLVDKRG